jgi:hypothetical protein
MQNYYIICFDFFKPLNQKNVFFVEKQIGKRILLKISMPKTPGSSAPEQYPLSGGCGSRFRSPLRTPFSAENQFGEHDSN